MSESGDESSTSSCEALVSSTTSIGSIARIGPIFNKKAINRGRWTKEEDDKLKLLVDNYGEHEWHRIASSFVDRSDIQCQQRWDKVVNPKLIKGPWTKQVG
jgi:hypothetical protein